MEFSVIYSVDVPSNVSLAQFMPCRRHMVENFQTTETDEQYEYEHLGGAWKKGRHRKVCGILNRVRFESFIERVDIVPQDVHTLGSIGAPGCGIGIAPAVYFSGDNEHAIQCAYVTPLADIDEARKLWGLDWNVAQQWMLEEFAGAERKVIQLSMCGSW